MDVFELLNSETMKLPITYDEKDYFPDILKQKLEKYLKAINNLDNTNRYSKYIQDNFEKINKLIRYIKKAIYNYYSGYPAAAYSSLKKGMEYIIEEINLNDKAADSVDSDVFYRLRVSDSYLDKYTDLFHVPFELRETKVSSQRYSIPGLPCLYLGSSVYICWEELGRRSFDKCYISKLKDTHPEKLGSNYRINKIINLGHRPDIQYLYLKSYSKRPPSNDLEEKHYYLNYFILWPLMAACSVKAINKNKIFFPEHIIPQLLLQWVTNEKDFDGIKYFSMNLNFEVNLNDYKHEKNNLNYVYNKYVKLYQNYVFPVKSYCNKGFCGHLSRRFEISNPLPWRLFNAYKSEISGSFMTRDIPLITIENLDIRYDSTDFGLIEEYLKTVKFYKITNDNVK